MKDLQYQCTSEASVFWHSSVWGQELTNVEMADCITNSERFLDCRLWFQERWCCWTSYSQNCSHVRVESWSSVRWLDLLTFWKTTACSEVSNTAELMVSFFADWTLLAHNNLQVTASAVWSIEVQLEIQRLHNTDSALITWNWKWPIPSLYCQQHSWPEEWRHTWSHIS